MRGVTFPFYAEAALPVSSGRRSGFLKAKRFFVNAVRCCEMVVQPRWTKWKLLVVRLDACIQAD